MFVVGVVCFALAIAVAIMLHEAGHLLTAKAFRMKATEYFVGFGPKIWSFRRGETEYGLKAVPAGGYVKITGMTDLEPLAPEDEDRAFYKQGAVKRTVVLAAGSVTHFVLAFVTLYLLVVFYGYSTFTPDHPRIDVAQCVPALLSATDENPCGPGDPAPPSAAAGLQDGDVLLAVDGQPVRQFPDASEAIRAAGDGPLTVLVERDGREVRVVADLAQVDVETEQGVQTVPYLGISARQVPVRTYGPVEGLQRAWEAEVDLFEATYRAVLTLPSRVPNLWESVFLGDERDPEGVISVVGASRLGGEAVEAGYVEAAFLFFAGLNIFIGVFNLFPLLPLDGGHIAILWFERGRARLLRLFGRPDPGRVDIRKLLPVTYVVVLVVGTFSLLAITADVVAPVANPFR